MRRRSLAVAWGVAAVALYALAATVSFRSGLLPVRPLYDGLAPPAPYRWVSPPPELAESNRPPEPVTDTVELAPEGSRARSISTPDGQALLILSQGAFPPRKDQTAVRVRIRPQSPARYPPPPKRLRIDGNVYVVDAAYLPSGQAAALAQPASLVLRYPRFGSVILLRRGRTWTRLETRKVAATLQLFADTPSLGAFAAAGIPEPQRAWARYAVAGGLGVAAAVAGYLSARRAARRRPRTRQQRRAERRRRRRR